jgi:hypothetical protein
MLLDSTSDAEFLKQIEGRPVTVDQWQLEKLALVTKRQRLFYYVPGLPADYHANLWGRAYPALNAAVEALTSGLPPNATIAVIPEGPYVLAKAHAHAMVSG